MKKVLVTESYTESRSEKRTQITVLLNHTHLSLSLVFQIYTYIYRERWIEMDMNEIQTQYQSIYVHINPDIALMSVLFL